MTNLVLVLHVIAGTIALLAGIIAMSSRKGARAHRVAGTVFVVSMLVMAILADYLAVAIPEQIPNLFIGTFTIYLVATAWLTVRRKGRIVGIPEKIALVVILCLSVPFCDPELSVSDWLETFFQECCSPRRPCPHCDLLLHILRRYGGDWRLQVSTGGWHYGCATHWAASLAYVFGTYSGGRFSVHQRFATAPPEHSACSANPLVSSSTVFAGVARLLDDPRAVYRLVQRFDAELEARFVLSANQNSSDLLRWFPAS